MKATIGLKNDVDIHLEFKNFILKLKHPCVMARSIFKMENYRLKVYDSINSINIVSDILENINDFIENYDFESNNFESFIVCFKYDYYTSELAFEQALWGFLQKLHNLDSKPWDHRVSQKPSDSDFSFSLGGRAFFIVGMHPNSSRLARQSPYPAIVFNLHSQFEKLRETGAYEKIQIRIRKRDKKFQGTINPMLNDFGIESEAKQYSGRNVEANWKCPFHINLKNT